MSGLSKAPQPLKKSSLVSCAYIESYCSQGRDVVSYLCMLHMHTHIEWQAELNKAKNENPASESLHFFVTQRGVYFALTYQMQGNLHISAQRCRMIKSAVLEDSCFPCVHGCQSVSRWVDWVVTGGRENTKWLSRFVCSSGVQGLFWTKRDETIRAINLAGIGMVDTVSTQGQLWDALGRVLPIPGHGQPRGMHTSLAKPCVFPGLTLTYFYLGTPALVSPSNDLLLWAAGAVWLCQPPLSENRKLMCVHSFTLPRIDYAASALIILYNKSQSIQHWGCGTRADGMGW